MGCLQLIVTHANPICMTKHRYARLENLFLWNFLWKFDSVFTNITNVTHGFDIPDDSEEAGKMIQPILKVGQSQFQKVFSKQRCLTLRKPCSRPLGTIFVRANGESQLSNKVCRQIVNLYTLSSPGKVVTHDDVQLR